MRTRDAMVLLGITLGLSLPAGAHEVRPGFLELTSEDGRLYQVLWKAPMRGDAVLSIRPVFPARCVDRVPPSRRAVPGALLERRSLDCGAEGLAGETIVVDGLAQTLTDVVVRVAHADGATQRLILKPDAPSFALGGAQPWTEVAASYVRFGTEHIWLGADHLLFVLGLLLIVRTRRRLVEAITAFTVAHSVTLAMASLGYANVPQAPVEAVIALSIVFLAREIVLREEGRAGITERNPWTVAFVFGLLHGFGFAGALREVGLPPDEIPLALVSFNVGVELGQLAFVACVLVAAAVGRRVLRTEPRRLRPALAYAIGSVSAWWLLQRLAGILSAA